MAVASSAPIVKVADLVKDFQKVAASSAPIVKVADQVA